MTGNRDPVGHARNEVADGAQSVNLVAAALPPFWQQRGIGAVRSSEVGDDPLRFRAHRLELGKVVQTGVKEALQLALLGLKRRGKAGQLPSGRS